MTESESGAPFQAPEPHELAPLFPDYEVQYLIACGGMGAVYHCIQKALERPVAIKILPTEFSDDAEFCQSFTAEARAMAKVNHPNLISVFDFGEVAGMLFIVMEYVAGQSLFDALGGEALDPKEAIRLTIGTAEGLAHAHENGILHRDIKPANILLNVEAEPKIGDFGLASQLGRQVQDGEAIFGTPGYTAPEVIEPPHVFDHKADIFSLGVMLHELLTGKLPTADPRPASHISGCDARLDQIIKKATHPNPALRYASAVDLANDLRNLSAPNATRGLVTRAPATIAMAGARPGVRPAAPAGGAWTPRPGGQQMLSQPKSGGGLVWVLIIIAVAIGAVFVLKPDLIDSFMSGEYSQEINQPLEPSLPDKPVEEKEEPNKVFDLVLPE